MGAVGYYLALTSPEPELEHTGAGGIAISDPIAIDSPDKEGGIELRYDGGDTRDLQFALEQSHQSGEARMVTELGLALTEARRSAAEGIELDREYQRIGVSIQEDGRPVDAEIAAQIESLLSGTRAVSTVSPIGKPSSFDWRSVTNPQVRQTLYILRHATRLLTPHLRRDAVNPGDTWRYTLPAEGVGQSRFVESIDGQIEIRNTFVGTVERQGRRLAVIERAFDLSGDGEVTLEDEPGSRWFELTGKGTGRVLFDIDRGAVVESRLSLDRTLKMQGTETDSQTREGQIELLIREAPENGSG